MDLDSMPEKFRRVRDAFDRLLEMPADARDDALDVLGLPADERLEVISLLRGHAHGGLFDAPLRDWLDELDAGDDDAHALIGKEIGACRLVRLIGHGGSSIVFLADRRVGATTQPVALKLLNSGLTSPEAHRRFRREQAILSRLSHPNIARLIDAGTSESGNPFIVMEYVDGTDIVTYATTRSLDSHRRVGLLIDICRAVEAAHRGLVVHRDLKPSNVLVTGDGLVKVLDFGIAKLLDDDHPETATQHIALTPAYAAPEQFLAGPATTLMDVYSLGVLASELLLGARLGPDAVLPATETSITRQRWRRLDHDLAQIVRAALASEPNRRYSSAGHLADDLGRYLRREPLQIVPMSRWYRFRKFASRHRTAVAATVLIVAVCVAAALVSLREAAAARTEAVHAEAVRAFLVGVFEQANPDENKGRPISAQQLLDKGEKEIAVAAAGDPEISTDLTALIGNLYWDLGEYSRAEPLLDQAVAASADPRVSDDARARALVGSAQMYLEKRVYETAIAQGRRAVDVARRSRSHDRTIGTKARQVLASALIGHGDAKLAEPLLADALAEDTTTSGASSEAVYADLMMHGYALDELSQYDTGEADYRRAIAIAEMLHGSPHSTIANAYSALGVLLGHKGELAEAEQVQRAAVSQCEAIFGADHAETLTMRSNLLFTIERRGLFDEALPERLAMLERQKRVADGRPGLIALTYDAIGNDYRGLGRFGEAETAYRASIEAWTRAENSDAEWVSVDATTNLAQDLMLDGRYAEAEATIRKAIAIEARHEPPDSHWLNRDRSLLGDILRLDGREAESLETLRGAEAAVSPIDHPDPPTMLLLARVSEAELDANDIDAAERAAAAALDMARNVLPARNYQLGAPLFAKARVELARHRPDVAEPLLREALAVRHPPHPDHDPRVLEVEVALVEALAMRGNATEAKAMRADVASRLAAAGSGYVATLRTRLTRAVGE